MKVCCVECRALTADKETLDNKWISHILQNPLTHTDSSSSKVNSFCAARIYKYTIFSLIIYCFLLYHGIEEQKENKRYSDFLPVLLFYFQRGLLLSCQCRDCVRVAARERKHSIVEWRSIHNKIITLSLICLAKDSGGAKMNESLSKIISFSWLLSVNRVSFNYCRLCLHGWFAVRCILQSNGNNFFIYLFALFHIGWNYGLAIATHKPKMAEKEWKSQDSEIHTIHTTSIVYLLRA